VGAAGCTGWVAGEGYHQIWIELYSQVPGVEPCLGPSLFSAVETPP